MKNSTIQLTKYIWYWDLFCGSCDCQCQLLTNNRRPPPPSTTTCCSIHVLRLTFYVPIRKDSLKYIIENCDPQKKHPYPKKLTATAQFMSIVLLPHSSFKYNCQMQLSHRKIRAPCKWTFSRCKKYKKWRNFIEQHCSIFILQLAFLPVKSQVHSKYKMCQAQNIACWKYSYC